MKTYTYALPAGLTALLIVAVLIDGPGVTGAASLGTGSSVVSFGIILGACIIIAALFTINRIGKRSFAETVDTKIDKLDLTIQNKLR